MSWPFHDRILHPHERESSWCIDARSFFKKAVAGLRGAIEPPVAGLRGAVEHLSVRMVDWSSASETGNWLVCVLWECATSVVFCLEEWLGGWRRWCFFFWLGSECWLHVPSVCTYSKDSEQDCDGQSGGSFRPSRLARSAVGPRSSSVGEAVHSTSRVCRSPSLPKSSQPSPSDAGSEAYSFMARWGLFNVEVWNTIFSAVAPSTRISYENVFHQFVGFMEEGGVNFVTLSVNEMLSFMQSFVGKLKSRIWTVVAALKLFLRVYRREDLADHPLVTLFGKGTQNMAPLPREKVAIWNPQVVLNWLKEQPIPSLFLACAKEAILLLLLATGWRVDDVWKLENRVECLEDCARFFFWEKRKCKIKRTFSVSQSVGWFPQELRICPIKAVNRFLFKASEIWKVPSVSLFVSSTGNSASKDTLRHWVVELLARANVLASAGSCRSASTSAAFANDRSLDDIMKSAWWSLANIFRRYYQREVLQNAKPLNLMLSK